jgi:phage terminase small subunit
MGFRGPLRDPGSRRGAVEMPNSQDSPELPQPPSWLGEAAQTVFIQIVNELVEAQVPLKRVDGHSIGMAATCIAEVKRWTEVNEALSAHDIEMRMQCSQVIARNQRDLQGWLAAIGGTVKSRAQMGLRGKKEEKKLGAVASILQAKRGAG